MNKDLKDIEHFIDVFSSVAKDSLGEKGSRAPVIPYGLESCSLNPDQNLGLRKTFEEFQSEISPYLNCSSSDLI